MWITRLIFAAIGAFIAHLEKGFSLYDDLTPDQRAEGQDVPALFYMRMFLLWFLVGFTIYLITSCVCFMCILDCFDGGQIRRGQGRRMKRIPFGSLVFDSELDCAVCLNRFRAHSKVVQLECHNNHVFHSGCIRSWIEAGHNSCPLCRQPIRVASQ